MLISWSLWGDERSFPRLPIFDIPIGSSVVLVFLFMGVAGMLFNSENRIFKALTISSLILLVFLDINRLQVWVYLWVAILMITSYSRKLLPDDIKIQTLQMLLIALYCWAGLHKLNPYFIEDQIGWILEPLISTQNVSPAIGIIAAISELSIGVLLFFTKTRKIGFLILLCFHLSLLTLLGPIAKDWNSVVWPWNLGMIGIAYCIFIRSGTHLKGNLLSNLKRFPIFAFFFLLFAVLPAFNSFGYWDEQLSFKMYSGTQSEGIFYLAEEDRHCIPENAQQHLVVLKKQNRLGLIIDQWAFQDLKTPMYQSERTIKKLGEKLCSCVSNQNIAELEIIIAGRWSKADERSIYMKCNQLLQ